MEGFHRGERGIEGNPEFNQLRNLFATLFSHVKTGDRKTLENLLLQILEQEPQRNQSGDFRYLVTSGFAVELITGFRRDHHDLDLVILDPGSSILNSYGTDNVYPNNYWADMRLSSQVLGRTAQKVNFFGNQIYVVNPAILFVQKLSNAFGREPRPKDLEDAKAIYRYWIKNGAIDDNQADKEIKENIGIAINSLPEKERGNTVERIRDLGA